MSARQSEMSEREMDDLLYQAGDLVADVERELKRREWGLALDAKSLRKRIDAFRSDLSEALAREPDVSR